MSGLELLLVEPALDAPLPPELPPDDDDAAEAPPPLAVCPTWALTAVTVPGAGAFSTAPSSACCALVSVTWAEATAAWSAARSPGGGGAALSALLARVACWEFSEEVSAACAAWRDCWSRATPCVCDVWALVRPVWSLLTAWLSAVTFWLSDATAWLSACCWAAVPDDWSCCCFA